MANKAFKTSPNQRVVTIDKKIEGSFLQVNLEDIRTAYKNLKPTSFGLYLYLAENKNDFSFGFSSEDLHNCYGVRKASTTEAWKQLMQQGYITLNEGATAHYTFHTAPIVEKTPEELAEEFKKLTERKYIAALDAEVSYKDILDGFKGDKAKADKLWNMN